MLSISSQTNHALREDAENQFVIKLAAILKREVPEIADEPDSVFYDQVKLVIEQARSYGLRTEQNIGAYAITAGTLGLDFPEKFNGAREILESHEDEDRKAELLEYFTLALFEALEG